MIVATREHLEKIAPNNKTKQERERPAAEREQQRREELEAPGGRGHRQGRRQAGLLRGGEFRRER